jgi:hypothetical protein
MKEITELRAELAVLRQLVEDGFFGHRVALVACAGCFLAGCAVGFWGG